MINKAIICEVNLFPSSNYNVLQEVMDSCISLNFVNAFLADLCRVDDLTMTSVTGTSLFFIQPNHSLKI